MAVESDYNPAAIRGVGEVGLMQILPSTAWMLGFGDSNADLAMPAPTSVTAFDIRRRHAV